MTDVEIKEKKTTGKRKKETIVTNKQYSIFYNIGTDPNFFVTEGDDYQLTTIDIKSVSTGEIHSYPIVIVVDNDKDSADFIPWSTVGNLRYNWGFKTEAAKYTKELAALTEKMKNQMESVDPMDNVIVKKKIVDHDRQYV